MICGTCGSDNPSHLTFCQECGQRLAARVAPPTPPVGLAPPTFGAGPRPATAPLPAIPAAPMPVMQPAPMPVMQPAPMPPQPQPPTQRPAAPELRFASRTAPIPSVESIRCMTCGAPNQRGLRFCVSCGQALEGAAPPMPPAPSAPPAPTAPMPPAPIAPAISPAPPAIAHAPPAIAPARVVDLGGPPQPRATTRLCARCRGTCDATAQFCKFWGAPLSSAAPEAPPSITGPTMQAHEHATPPSSAVPDTPAMDQRAYRAFQAMSAEPTARPSSPAQAATARPPAPDPRAETGVMSPIALPTHGRIVIIARDGGEGPSFPLAQSEGETTDIGRTEGHVLLTEDRYISPRHARLQRRGGCVYLRDLGSVNGIYLRIPSPGGALATVPPPRAEDAEADGAVNPNAAVDIVDQDLFLVGQQVLRFEVVNDAEEGYGTASQHGTLLFGTPASPRYARLSQRTVEGVTRDVFYIRKVETVLGRESGDIVFTEDPFLSRRHAAIRYDREKKKFSLADLGSSNGTFLQIREEVRLKDGDHFRIGQQLFRVDIDSSPGLT